MRKILLDGLLFGALVCASQVSSAALSGADTVTINFPANNMGSEAYGYGANMSFGADGLCPETGGASCYYEDDYVLGSPTDGDVTNHIHRTSSISGGNFQDKSLAYHSDSAGIYLRALDGSAFDLSSMLFNAQINGENLIYGSAGVPGGGLSDLPADISQLGSQEKWEIFGFSDAVNESITANDGYATAVAQASIVNGFVGTVGTDAASNVVLGDAFKNVSAIWIHYLGYPTSPNDGIVFKLRVDNIVLAAPAAVPLPSAVWLFGSSLLGFLSFGRKKSA